MIIEVVSATRKSEQEFWQDSALGYSLRRLEHLRRYVPSLPECTSSVAFRNSRGLPEIYNARILASRADLLVFMHDDVWIDDNYFAERIVEGLAAYDVIGVCGNRRRVDNMVGWALLDERTVDDRANMSGRIGHGETPFGRIDIFGAAPAECELLDGVMLAARRSELFARNVLFDASFAFHFYDLDFCRTARERGLRLGTWPIVLTHQSQGGFFSDAWRNQYRAYINKWGG